MLATISNVFVGFMTQMYFKNKFDSIQLNDKSEIIC